MLLTVEVIANRNRLLAGVLAEAPDQIPRRATHAKDSCEIVLELLGNLCVLSEQLRELIDHEDVSRVIRRRCVHPGTSGHVPCTLAHGITE